MLGVIALERSVDLKLTAGEGTVFDNIASIDAAGNLIVYGHDVLTTPDPFAATRSCDHWVIVPEEDKDFVLLQLLRERFLDDPAPCAEFMSWLNGHGIPHEVGSPAGEHRGEARMRVKVHRRNGARVSNPTRAGP